MKLVNSSYSALPDWDGVPYVHRANLGVDAMRSDSNLGQLYTWWLWQRKGDLLPSANINWNCIEAGGLDLELIHLVQFEKDAPEHSQFMHCGVDAFEGQQDNTGRSPVDFYKPLFSETVIVDWATAAYFSSPSYQRIEHTANGKPASFYRLLLPLTNESNKISTHLLVGIVPETPRRD